MAPGVHWSPVALIAAEFGASGFCAAVAALHGEVVEPCALHEVHCTHYTRLKLRGHRDRDQPTTLIGAAHVEPRRGIIYRRAVRARLELLRERAGCEADYTNVLLLTDSASMPHNEDKPTDLILCVAKHPVTVSRPGADATCENTRMAGRSSMAVDTAMTDLIDERVVRAVRYSPHSSVLRLPQTLFTHTSKDTEGH